MQWGPLLGHTANGHMLRDLRPPQYSANSRMQHNTTDQLLTTPATPQRSGCNPSPSPQHTHTHSRTTDLSPSLERRIGRNPQAFPSFSRMVDTWAAESSRFNPLLSAAPTTRQARGLVTRGADVQQLPHLPSTSLQADKHSSHQHDKHWQAQGKATPEGWPQACKHAGAAERVVPSCLERSTARPPWGRAEQMAVK